MKPRLLVIFLTVLLVLSQLGYGQISNRAEVVSSGGNVSSGGVYSNFNTVGEPAVNIIAGGSFIKKIGFLYQTGPDPCPVTIYPLHYDFNSARRGRVPDPQIPAGGYLCA